MLFITGDQAHSKKLSEDAYKRAAMPKELVYINGAGDVDLYDKTDLIPFNKLRLAEALSKTAWKKIHFLTYRHGNTRSYKVTSEKRSGNPAIARKYLLKSQRMS